MEGEIALLRHFEDRPDYNGDRDTEIVDIGPDRIKEISGELVEFAERNKKRVIHFVTSDLKRSAMTTELITKDITKSKTGIITAVEVDERIRALKHGIYNKQFVQRFPQIEKMALGIYLKETFEFGNIAYRFGDPLKSEAGTKYPELLGYFSALGENQIEFSIRIYDFVLDLVKKLKDENEVVVVSSHTAPLLRICEINSVAKSMELNFGEKEALKPGDLVSIEWSQTVKILEELSVLNNTGRVLLVDIGSVDKFTDTLKSEVAFLRGLKEGIRKQES